MRNSDLEHSLSFFQENLPLEFHQGFAVFIIRYYPDHIFSGEATMAVKWVRVETASSLLHQLTTDTVLLATI